MLRHTTPLDTTLEVLREDIVRTAPAPLRGSSKAREYWTFLRRAVRAPDTIGAVLPTARRVGEATATVVPSAECTEARASDAQRRPVVELGPGTGALSEAISHRIGPRTRHLAVEIDPTLVDYLRSAKPWLEVVHGDAANLPDLLGERGIDSVDALITSIPWTLLDASRQRQLLTACAQVLAPSAPLTTVTYVTTLWRKSTRDFHAALHDTFDEVLPRSTILGNVPPARIYVCRRAKRG